MIRYVVALFLINTYSQSLGASAEEPKTSRTMSELLGSLAKHCGNSFIKAEIETAIPNCAPTDGGHKRLFECIIFYTINNQLCYAINNSKLVIDEDYSAQVTQELNVQDLCDAAKDWTFSKNGLEVNLSKVFQDPLKCEKFCGVDDPFSTDSVYYCKYFKWGWEKLNSQAKPVVLETAPKITSSGAASPVVSTSVGTSQTNVSSKTSDLNVNIQSPLQNLNGMQEQKEVLDIQVPVSSNPGSTKPVTNATVTNPLISTGGSASSKGDATNDNVNLNLDVTGSLEKVPISAKINVTTPDIQTQNKVNIINSKQNDDTGDDNLDVGGNDMDADDVDDNDDSEIPDNAISEPKDTRIGGDFSQKEYYSPDLAPDDDHFFPFFLTAIILVVLLYVLYHNKGKVTKVFLGLIVEGRQNGRRRNSRGHAYRRLDTLEQAMSGNLAAQPSKIIY